MVFRVEAISLAKILAALALFALTSALELGGLVIGRRKIEYALTCTLSWPFLLAFLYSKYRAPWFEFLSNQVRNVIQRKMFLTQAKSLPEGSFSIALPILKHLLCSYSLLMTTMLTKTAYYLPRRASASEFLLKTCTCPNVRVLKIIITNKLF